MAEQPGKKPERKPDPLVIQSQSGLIYRRKPNPADLLGPNGQPIHPAPELQKPQEQEK